MGEEVGEVVEERVTSIDQQVMDGLAVEYYELWTQDW